MENLTIKFRIIVLGLLAVGGILLAGGIGIFQLSRFDERLEANLTEIRAGAKRLGDIQNVGVEFKSQVQEWKNILLRGNRADQFARYEKAFNESEQAVRDGLKKSLELVRAEGGASRAGAIVDLEQLLKDHAELATVYRSALAAFDKADPEAGKKADAALAGKDRAVSAGLIKVIAALNQAEVDELNALIAGSEAAYVHSRNLLIALMAIGFIVAGGIVIVTVRQISGQLELVQSAAAEVRETLNLARRIPVVGRNELAQVATSVNVLLDEFQSVLRGMKTAGRDVSATSDELSRSVADLAAAVGQQNEVTSSMAASVEEMTVSVTHVSDSSATAQDIARESLANAELGGEIVGKSVREMVEMAETVAATSQTMEKLSSRTEEIGSIVGVIKEIADQTNLLALNAAIEAARAGEQGRGFAVVADEVRKLAERTTVSTKEVAVVIAAIQTETHNAVANMHRIVDQVTANAESGRQAGEAIVHIRVGSARVVEVSSSIAAALKEQSAASELIARQIEVIASMSERNASAMSDAKKASGEMKQLSGEMHATAERFAV